MRATLILFSLAAAAVATVVAPTLATPQTCARCKIYVPEQTCDVPTITNDCGCCPKT